MSDEEFGRYVRNVDDKSGQVLVCKVTINYVLLIKINHFSFCHLVDPVSVYNMMEIVTPGHHTVQAYNCVILYRHITVSCKK